MHINIDRTSHSSFVPLVDINISHLADNESESAANTLDGGQGIWDLDLSVNVGVVKTQNVRETLISKDNRLQIETISAARSNARAQRHVAK